MQVLSNLNNATVESGKLGAYYLDSNNRIINLVNSGSKGSTINIGQMIACVGQQSVDGKRIPYGFTNRTLPHFHKYDDGAMAIGFVENSFVRGLTPTEFFFHAMGGREGLIDTAVKTSETGYIQRKLVKGMEDIRIESDYSVRDSNGTIVQFLYGEDGIEPTAIEKQYLSSILLSYNDLINKYQLKINDNWKLHLNNETYEKFISYDRSFINNLFKSYFDKILEDKKHFIENIHNNELINGSVVYYPINIKRLVINAYKNIVISKLEKHSDLDPIYILVKINELAEKLTISNIFKENQLLLMLIRCYLSPKELIFKYNFSKLAFDYVVATISQKFFSSISQPGDLVGIISAQSIGEPSTQMTLNTFHFAGVSSKSQVTRGLARFKELLSATKNVKSPFLTIYLKDEYAHDKQKAADVINEISIINIKELTLYSEIYFESTCKDSDLLKIYEEFESIESLYSNYKKNPWILRFEFDRHKMIEKNIKMNDIYYAIISKFNSCDESIIDDISCVFSDDNASNLIFRLQYINKISDNCNESEICLEEDTICILRALENTILNDIVLKGIKNIKNASMMKKDYIYKYNVDTNNFDKNPEWIIDTEGSNLLDIVSHYAVDPFRTISNDIHEVYNILGIEACRQILIQEINDIFEQSSSYVNNRHIALLADVMTNNGILMSIDRHGINKSDRGPLAKCSFEETPDVIAKAAIFGELDTINGVSSNIMLGQEVPIGTGSIDILFDEEKFLEYLQDSPDISENISIESENDVIESKSIKDTYIETMCQLNMFEDNSFNL